MVYQYVNDLPLTTFVVWSLIAGFQVYRRKVRTLTELAFILGSLSWAGYALADWLAFHVPDAATGRLMGLLGLSFVTAAAFFLLLFTKLFLTRPHRWDALLVVPFGLALAAIWSGGILLDVESAPWGWRGVFAPGPFLGWLLFVIVYAAAALRYLYRTYLVVREESAFLGRRVYGIFVALLVTLALGLGTNTVFETLGIGLMPLFSSLLVVPGLMVAYVLLLPQRERVSTAIRRFKSRRYRILGVYLIYENGTLVASRTAVQDQQVDDDIFGATLDAIQTFMRTSFPLLVGKWLRRIEHGDVKILIERGRYCYLALVIEGDDPDTLWIKMREAVTRFERTNGARLAHWQGVVDDLQAVDDTLEDMFQDRAVFA